MTLNKLTYLMLIKMLFKKLFDTWTSGSYLTVYKTEWERNIKNSKHKTNDGRYSVWKLACELVAGWDCSRKSNAFKEHYLACLNIIVMGWNFGASNKVLSSALLLFRCDNALQCRNLEYLHILLSANCQFILWKTIRMFWFSFFHYYYYC